MKISNRIKALAESQSLQMAARCQELRQQGVDVVSMSLGEPDFPTPAHIKQAVKDAVDADFSHYGQVPGLLSLREAIAGDRYTANDVIVSVGAKQAICHAVMALINPGDEVVIPTPCWVSYSEMVKLAEGTSVFVPTTYDTDYKLTAQQLEAAITPKTKLLILCSPNNPTGSVYSHQELVDLVAVLVRHPQVYVISDEIYNRIIYTGHHESLAQFSELSDRLILIDGVSKAYAMTGYRVGWMICKDKEVVAACKKLQSQEITCATMVAQKAAEAAVRGSQDCVEQMRRIFEQRRDLMVTLAREIPGIHFEIPEGAFYLFPDVSEYYGKGHIHNSNDMAEYLLNDAHVAVVSGSAFGEDHCIRLSYATSEDNIREAMRRIRISLAKLM